MTLLKSIDLLSVMKIFSGTRKKNLVVRKKNQTEGALLTEDILENLFKMHVTVEDLE